MARVDAIPDGQPLTYEIINQLISQVNKIKDVPEEEEQLIEISTPKVNVNNKDQVAKIHASIKDFTLAKNDSNKRVEVNFPKETFTDNPIVVASIMDMDKSVGGISMANLTIIEVTNKGFVARVQTLKSSKDLINLKVSYIAIGPGKSAA